MRKLAFLLLLCLISCGDAERKANGMLSDEENVKIKEYITKQFQAKKSVNLKRTFGTNLKGLKLTGVSLAGKIYQVLIFQVLSLPGLIFPGPLLITLF